jgi:hypothetical protein
LIQHRFPPKHASQRAILAHKIAKRQSSSRKSVMAAMVDISQVKSSKSGSRLRGDNLADTRHRRLMRTVVMPVKSWSKQKKASE